MHNGLTRLKTKLASGEWADEKMSGSIGNVVSARELIDKHGADLIRYLLLSTHYRRPIEFTDECWSRATQGAVGLRASVRARRTDHRLSRTDRSRTWTSSRRPARRPARRLRAGFAGVQDEVSGVDGRRLQHRRRDRDAARDAGSINAFIERTEVEKTKAPDPMQCIAAGTQSVRRLGSILGLF
jgi:cysteinyl-tRNA synthetase